MPDFIYPAGATLTINDDFVYPPGAAAATIGGAALISWPAAIAAVVAPGSYVLMLGLPWQTGAITGLIASTAQGSFAVTVLANGAAVPGLVALFVNNATPTLIPAGPNTLSFGTELALLISGVSGTPTDATVQVSFNHSEV